MGYDKVVDSTVLDNGLKSIADAIREKAGLEDNFAFPAGFAEAIAGIETGGGGGLSIEKQTVTPSSDVREISIPAVNTSEIKFVWIKHQLTNAPNNNELFAGISFLSGGTLYFLTAYSYKSGTAAFIIGNGVKTGVEMLPTKRSQLVQNETAPVVRIDNNNVYFGSPNGAYAFAGTTYTFYIGR